ncbi:MAG: glycogen/starch synthase, partial [Oscillospiraceae bacterium]|nr:glycogen/starch synthase [Oscillospiraceae bacterium]
MKIAILASEGAPYAKSGGLGDVMEALPSALAKIRGNEVTLFLPYYKKIKENPKYEVEDLGNFEVGVGWRQAYAGIMKLKGRADGVQVYFIDSEYYFGARPGAIYGDIDDGERFAFFSKACLDAMVIMDQIPDVIQCNDWQTALVPTYLKAMYGHLFPHTRCMYTIHNIEYQGWAHSSFFDDVLYLPWEWRGCLDMNGAVNMMKAAIETADMVTTVSETYARELMYPYYAHG